MSHKSGFHTHLLLVHTHSTMAISFCWSIGHVFISKNLSNYASPFDNEFYSRLRRSHLFRLNKISDHVEILFISFNPGIFPFDGAIA
jgi:hypothetical protein